ncbi:MAG: hypothetical protein CL840_14090 [Crocinitomicaceae bacterium]|nr:hypothetical protein [Crocinitomicaceae bacterium]
MTKTTEQFDEVIAECREIYEKKMKDYGAAWRILRPSSLTDQIFIKANRIKTLEKNVESKVNEGIRPEYIGIINYCIMAIIQLELGETTETELDIKEGLKYYDKQALEAKNLMLNKNHDYGEAWRDMRISSFTDLILMKILRTKQIENNDGKTLISEGIDANYFDMLNYSVFAMIQMNENA